MYALLGRSRVRGAQMQSSDGDPTRTGIRDFIEGDIVPPQGRLRHIRQVQVYRQSHRTVGSRRIKTQPCPVSFPTHSVRIVRPSRPLAVRPGPPKPGNDRECFVMNAFCSVMGDEPIPLARLDPWDGVLPAAINEGIAITGNSSQAGPPSPVRGVHI